MTANNDDYVFTQLGFLIRGYLLRLGLTQGLWQEFGSAVAESTAHNEWFTEESVRRALSAIAEEMLAPDKFCRWRQAYPPSALQPRRVGIIMAGNFPMAGFHDLLCVLCSGHTAIVKLSSKDPFLLPMLYQQMVKIDYTIERRVFFVSQLDASIDAVIATGSDASAAVFAERFGHLPHIFRQSKMSAAVLQGSESRQELQALADDITAYCGLGCRSVSRLLVPKGYDFAPLQQTLTALSFEHNHFADAYRYVKALCVARGEAFIDCGCLLLQEKEGNPLTAQAFVEYYDSENDLQSRLQRRQHLLQCLASRCPIANFEQLYAAFGSTQRPQLYDYADRIDIMQWLLGLPANIVD